MKIMLPWMFAIALNSYALPSPTLSLIDILQLLDPEIYQISETYQIPERQQSPELTYNLAEIKALLEKESPSLGAQLIAKVMTTLDCANQFNTPGNSILTIIDYSLPSNEKRLWVFDLNQKKQLFHTYVSHGLKSGALTAEYFSNKNNSKASSLGVFQTEQTYYGRDGLSLRLNGLEKRFNDNAMNRYIVMHGGWYVEESFIKKYGRPGRSWGCPALPLSLTQALINTIKNNSLFIVYSPDDDWLLGSKFLHCKSNMQDVKIKTPIKTTLYNDSREVILFADLKNHKVWAENTPILAMPTISYQAHFNHAVPLERMLRRQIDNQEYIALSQGELKQFLLENTNSSAKVNKESFQELYFIIPLIKNVRGYYETQLKTVFLGSIQDIQVNETTSEKGERMQSYLITFDSKKTITLRPTESFIRWVGL